MIKYVEPDTVVRASDLAADEPVYHYDVFTDAYRQTTASKMFGMLLRWNGEQWRVHSNER